MNVAILESLANLIAKRKVEPLEGSYTNALFAGGDNKIIKKLGEENAEYIRAFYKGSDSELAGEAADYLYHLLVSLEYRGVDFDKVLDILVDRHR
jgi:phosphoribosyl-ATP pyrophosphohydrolase/phosphoribosyl-ATP pyrophosphohydrolase/phosphoribosyl-AMP cyclohydrolase